MHDYALKPAWELTGTTADDEPEGAGRPEGADLIGRHDTCPVCGKVFLRRCRRDEWGWWWKGEKKELVLLCSGPCAARYAEDRARSDALKIYHTKAYSYRCQLRDGLTPIRIARRDHISPNTVSVMVQNLELYHWTELQWIEEHREEIA